MDQPTEQTKQTEEPRGSDQLGTNNENDGGTSLPWADYAMTLLIGLVSALVVTVAYHYFVSSQNKLNMGTIDVAEVMQIKELQLTLAVSKKGVSDVDRAAAYDSIKTFAKDLESAIDSIQTDCNCVILVKAAVVKGLPDHTASLKKKLSMDGISLESLVATLRSQGTDMPGNNAPETLGGKK